MEISKSDLLQALSNADILDDEEETVRWGYSGRYMYGEKCFGFTGSMDQYGRFLIAILETVFWQTEEITDSVYIAQGFADAVRTDSMGYDTIFYFPGIQVLESE